MTASRLAPVLAASVFALAALAGCATPSDPAVQATTAFRLPLDIHIVTVGFNGFDAAQLSNKLEQPAQTFELVRAFTTGHLERTPLQYDVHYIAHAAPEAFAQDLFAFAASTDKPALPDSWLANYDRNHGNRVCPPTTLPGGTPNPVSVGGLVQGVPKPSLDPTCKEIQKFDARAVEAWIADHRATYGLDFGGASQTLFVLDSYTNGYLPKDNYHQYELRQDHLTGLQRTLRAWGGSSDFVFLDASAAPSAYDYRPWIHFTQNGVSLLDAVDGPIWEYAQDMPTFYDNLARDALDAVEMLWARDPIYPFEYSEHYILPTYVIIDPQASGNPASVVANLNAKDVKANTDEAGIKAAFQALVPWAKVDQEFHYIYLPNDDPDLAAAIQDAKTRTSTGNVDYGVVKAYFRDHMEKYAPPVEGARVYPTFALWIDEPATGTYAFSDGDEWGRSWGVFFNVADALHLCIDHNIPVCDVVDRNTDPGVFWELWNLIFVHELGHSFGLMHPHDTGAMLGNDPSVKIDWLWDSTSTPMTYRHELRKFNTWDVELLERNHAINLALDVLGRENAPATAKEDANAALDLVRAGDEAGGFAKAQAAIHAVGGVRPVTYTPGEPSKTSVQIPLTGAPVGTPSKSPAYLYLGAVGMTGVEAVDVPFQLPAGADAVRFDLREQAAPSHVGWGAYLEVDTNGGKYLTSTADNGHGIVVLEKLEECQAGCTLTVWGYGGAQSAYDVTVTPLTKAA